MNVRHRFCCWSRVALFLCIVCLAPPAPAGAAQASAAIASAHPLATAAGYDILKRGGNAFDAAIAVAAALGVVEPYSSGLGGGGFFLLHRSSDRMQVMVDARETAPRAIRESQYFDDEGRPIRGATTRGGTSVAIPGLPAALVHIAERYASLPLAVSLAPAIRLAREGFEVDPRYVRMAGLRESFLRSGENTATFLDEGRLPAKGYILKQPDLALTLERIAREGTAGFYAGPTARSMLQAVNAAGGVWRMQDLSGYRVIERKPVLIEYHGARITAAALPSAGGVALAQSLQMLERFKLADIGEPATDHLVIETLRRAFQDRARYLADPDFVRVPVERLVSPSYADNRAAGIDPQHATASAALGVTEQVKAESHDTTHFSIIDAHGNRVAGTQTINLLFGSGIVAPGTGVLLNNEMDDFTLRSDVPNAFKLRGGPANRIEPGKRPLSSMTPAFVEDEKGVLVLGAPGGSRIVSQVLLAILAYLDMRTADVARIVEMARYHHQFWPDRVEIEPHRFSDAWIAAMSAKGHTIEIAPRAWGNMQAVFRSSATGEAQAASDPRGEDVGWY